jgi:hypothetical protein
MALLEKPPTLEDAMPKKPLTVTVNRRALLVRLERALKKDGRKIRVDRIGRQTRYLLVDTKQNSLVEVDVDLEEFAHRIGVLEPWERLAPP